MLIETFVETPRYTGAVYKASGWIHVGTTQGRGRYDRDKLYDKAPQGHLAPTPAKRLETHPQSLESAGSDKPVTGRRNIYSHPAQGCAQLGNKMVPLWYLDKNKVLFYIRKYPLSYWESGDLLVAGAGFVPATFRL